MIDAVMPRFIPYDPPPTKRKSCPVTGKRMFDDEREALEEAGRIRKEGGMSLGVYHCMSCDHWHFTSSR